MVFVPFLGNVGEVALQGKRACAENRLIKEGSPCL